MTKSFEDFKINVKLKLSALWISTMFCYVYGDFFSLFVPGRIDRLNTGNSGTGTTTPVTILMYAILLSLPALMVFLSVALRATINRIVNIVLGIFFTLVMILVVATSLGEWMLFYTYMGIVEIILTTTVVWIAWTWPKQKFNLN
jgi:hypothetical protein